MAREMPAAGPERDALVSRYLQIEPAAWSTDDSLVWRLCEEMLGLPGYRRCEVQVCLSEHYPYRATIWGGGDSQLGTSPADAVSKAVLYEMEMDYHGITPW